MKILAGKEMRGINKLGNKVPVSDNTNPIY